MEKTKLETLKEPEKKHSYRFFQTERGNEGIRMLAKYLESKHGNFTISINETHYSTGRDGYPDIVFGEYGIEVKRIETFSKKRFGNKEMMRAQLGQVSLLHESWNWLKEWCRKNKKIPMLVVVLTWGKKSPIFIKFSKEQIDQLQQKQISKKYVKISSWNALLEGEILR